LKINAIKLAFEEYFDSVEIVQVDSKEIFKQPINEEVKIGAEERAKQAIEQANADFGVGLEGGTIKVYGNYYNTTCCAITDKQGNMHTGFAGLWKCPKFVIDEMKKGNMK
jgi:inosine/xanthosine triphosphatase